MRISTFLAAALAVSLTSSATACTSDESDTIRVAVEDGFEAAGLEVTDRQIDCVTESIVEQLGGEEQVNELEDEYDEPEDLPDDVRQQLDDAGAQAVEQCDIEAPATSGD